MNVHKFSNGGYVAHGLTFNQDFCKLKISVWFSDAGEVLDCEGFDKLGRSRPVSEKVKRRLSSEFGYVVAIYNRTV